MDPAGRQERGNATGAAWRPSWDVTSRDDSAERAERQRRITTALPLIYVVLIIMKASFFVYA